MLEPRSIADASTAPAVDALRLFDGLSLSPRDVAASDLPLTVGVA